MKMYFKRKIKLSLFIFILVIGLATPNAVFAIDLTSSSIKGITDIANMGTPPELTAASAVLIDANTGQILYDKNSHEQKYPASTTKIMTAMLAIENLNLDDVVTADEEVSETSGSSLYLQEGEEIKVEYLLYGLMLHSSNDAAVALAKAVSGSVADFANLMNEKAVMVGAQNTHFTNPNGLPDEQHLTTAYDLAVISKAAFGHQVFRDLVSTVKYTIPETNFHEARTYVNGNKMLWDKREKYEDNGVKMAAYYEGTYGVKTGYTNDAGSCLVAAVNRDGHELIGVVLGSETEKHYIDMIKMMDYGFDTYDSVTICNASDYQYEVKVKKSETKKINIGLTEDIKLTLPSGVDLKKVTTDVSMEKKYKAPILQYQALGTISIYYGGELLTTNNLVAMAGATEKEGPDIVGILIKFGKVIGILAGLFIVVFLLFTIIVNKIYKSKKKSRKSKK